MTQWVDALKDNSIPEYAKDIRLNLDAVIKRSTLPVEEAEACALAAAFATGNSKLWTWMESVIENKTETQAALSAGAIMAQNNVWYPYYEMADNAFQGLQVGLRMNAIASHGGTTKERFEAYSLAASIVGKCHFCVKAHFAELKKAGYSLEQLRDIGRIAATMNAVAKIVAS